MATRLKTTEWFFPLDTTALAAATDRDTAAKTIDIPEGSPAFKSVMIEIVARQNDSTNVTPLTSWKIGVQLAAVAFDDVTITDSIASSGEHTSWCFQRDVASYFTTNWTGTSMSMKVRFALGTVSCMNIAIRVTITYEYNDASANTRAKTIWIPLDSQTAAALTNSLVEYGNTNQIPRLDATGGYLVEPSPVIKDMALVFMGQEACPGNATDFRLGVQIDAGAEVAEGLRESALQSSPSFLSVVSLIGAPPATNATHTVKARCMDITSRFQFASWLMVTYTYDHSSIGAGRTLNHVRIPVSPATVGFPMHGPATVTGDKQRFRFQFFIEEPGTITLLQSGILLDIPTVLSGTPTLSVACGAQTARAYSLAGASLTGGGSNHIMHRIDAGSAAGSAGITLARGLNTIDVDVFYSAAAIRAPNATLILNYTSDLDAQGDGAHNHTIEWNVGDTAADATPRDMTMAPDIPESLFWLNGVGVRSVILGATANAGENSSAGLYIECGANEGPAGAGAGWLIADPCNPRNDTENAFQILHGDITQYFKRHPADPGLGRLDVEASRTMRSSNNLTIWTSTRLMITYHTIKWTKTSPFSDWPSGNGGGLTISLHRDDTDEKVSEFTSAVGGVGTFDWYDNTIAIWAAGVHSSGYRARTDAMIVSSIP